MSYKSQEMENSNIGASVYALISLVAWFGSTFLTFTMANVQTMVSILGGLIAAISGAVSIYKNLKKK
jgi:uncharacterized Tic20 family protein